MRDPPPAVIQRNGPPESERESPPLSDNSLRRAIENAIQAGGLSICRRIVERHHGEITARSTPNAGATFIVILPARHGAEAI